MEGLDPGCLVGCVAQGIIGGEREVESGPGRHGLGGVAAGRDDHAVPDRGRRGGWRRPDPRPRQSDTDHPLRRPVQPAPQRRPRRARRRVPGNARRRRDRDRRPARPAGHDPRRDDLSAGRASASRSRAFAPRRSSRRAARRSARSPSSPGPRATSSSSSPAARPTSGSARSSAASLRTSAQLVSAGPAGRARGRREQARLRAGRLPDAGHPRRRRGDRSDRDRRACAGRTDAAVPRARRGSADEDLRLALAEALDRSGGRAAGALLFSCNGRGTRMFPSRTTIHGRSASMLGSSAVGGFFCGGEIGPVGGRSFLHGFTATMVVFPAAGRRHVGELAGAGGARA